MGKARRQVEERRKERKRQRKGQTLEEKVLTPGLHDRYATAANRLLEVLARVQILSNNLG